MAAPSGSFYAQVRQIKELLGIEEPAPIPAALCAANQMMGLPSEGTPPSQIEQLMLMIFASNRRPQR